MNATQTTAYEKGHQAGFYFGWKDGHIKGVEVGRVEERDKMSKTIEAMSWDASNETPDAVRILKSLHDLVSPLPDKEVSL